MSITKILKQAKNLNMEYIKGVQAPLTMMKIPGKNRKEKKQSRDLINTKIFQNMIQQLQFQLWEKVNLQM